MDTMTDILVEKSDKNYVCDNGPTLTDLPEECLRLVLSHLPLIDKFRLERVSKLWQNIIYDIQLAIRFTRLSAMSAQSRNYCQVFEHRVTNDDWLPQLLTFSSRTRQSPINLAILEKVLQKCGQTIRVVNLDLALINEEVFELFANYCPHLECISLNSSTGITDDCLCILAKNYGQKLRHINLQCAANRAVYFTSAGLSQFFTDCPRLQTMFLASIRSQKSYRLNGQHLCQMRALDSLCAPLPDVMIGDNPGLHLAQIQNCCQLSRLVIDGIIYSETTVYDLCENLCFLTQLKSLTLYTNCDNPLDTELIRMAKGVPGLQELHLTLNVITISTLEAISYFQCLKRLDFGIWKPFETGLLALTLLPLQYCPDLQVLRLSNLLLTDVIVENIHIFCPNLRKIYLNNMFDLSDDTLRSLSKCQYLRSIRIYSSTGLPNMASDVTENGVSNLLDSMSSLVLLEIPIVFDITDDLYSCFIRYAKKFPNNCLTFVCGDKAEAWLNTTGPTTGHKFSIVSKF